MSNLLFDQPLIKEDIKDNYRNHKFSGGDFSIFYRKIASPMCDYIINFFPETLA